MIQKVDVLDVPYFHTVFTVLKELYPTYDQGNRLSADVFDACASQRVCKDPSLWTSFLPQQERKDETVPETFKLHIICLRKP